ncbi:MAG: sugar ABC transporter substrate-binding protein [Oscillospiraceae bacterium]|nr:sugar ABC transporter substrate-binding protein [Oscillospiraceae bacterium]
MKKVLALLLASAMLFVLIAACAADEPTPAADPTPAPAADPTPAPEAPADEPADEPAGDAEVSNFDLGLIGLSLFTLDIPFPLASYEGARSAEADLGANLTVVDNGNDIATNVSQIEDLMGAGMAALVIMPVDVFAVTPVVEDVMAAGIPVVSVNRLVADIELDGVNHVWLGTDNVEAGYAKGEFFMTLVEEGAGVIILEGTPGASSGIDRLDGFTAATAGRLNILESITANFNRVDGLHVTEDLLVRFPDVRYIVAMNDEMALGAIQAALDAGRVPGEDIFITGFDGGGDARDAVAAGDMLFTVYQDPYGMGYMGVEVALGLLRGETFPPRILFDVGFVTE